MQRLFVSILFFVDPASCLRFRVLGLSIQVHGMENQQRAARVNSAELQPLMCRVPLGKIQPYMLMVLG